MTKSYYVYIIGNARPTLYVGVTNNLERRLYEHQNELIPGFSKTYHLHDLLYYEETDSIEAAVHREKQLKTWKRDWKIDLIMSINPQFVDLIGKFLNQVQDDNECVGVGVIKARVQDVRMDSIASHAGKQVKDDVGGTVVSPRKTQIQDVVITGITQ